MKNILLFAAVVGFAGMACGAEKDTNDSPTLAPKQTEQAKAEEPLGSQVNEARKELFSTVAQETKQIIEDVKQSEEAKETFKDVKNVGSNLNKLRKNFF